MTSSSAGSFTISLDFELMWGLFDKRSISDYGENILGTREAISRMLELFEKYDIGVTWATVGLLLCHDREEMLHRIEQSGLHLDRPDLVSYIKQVLGNDLNDDPYHFGSDIVDEILRTKRQEVGSHSFCHYGVQESYASIDGFAADTEAVKQLFKDRNIELSSYIFARNQIDEPYLKLISDQQFEVYRGLASQRLYASQKPDDLSLPIRAIRLLDSYLPITQIQSCVNEESSVISTQASRFLRPFTVLDTLFQPLKINRIKSEMSLSAKQASSYHLWWHPHNFGKKINKQLAMLEDILQHYCLLRNRDGWQNQNMREIADSKRAV